MYQTTLIQLAVLCEGKTDSTDLLNSVKSEVSKIDSIDNRYRSKVNSQEVLLYKTLHLTRTFDTSLQTFLSSYGVVPPDKSKHTIAGYAYELTQHSGLFHPLDGTTKKMIVEEIAYERNRFMHKSGAYPSRDQYRKLETKICSALQIVLTLPH